MIKELLRKDKAYSKELEYLEFVAKKINEIGHPVRLQITDLLRKSKKMDITELVNHTDIPSSDLANHLQILIAKGFVVETHEQDNSYFTLRDKQLIRLINQIKRSGYFYS